MGQRGVDFSQRKKDLDNLFIINCVISFFPQSELHDLPSKIFTKAFVSMTLSYQAFVSFIVFVFSTFVFTKGIRGYLHHRNIVISIIHLRLKFRGERKLLSLGDFFVVLHTFVNLVTVPNVLLEY